MSTHSPRTILIGWELGSGRGHLARLVPIIRALRHEGHTVIAAVRDLVAARKIFADVGSSRHPGSFMLGQAPIFVHKSPPGLPGASLPQMMAHIGFASRSLIQPVIDAWLALIRRFNPDVIVSDTAPSLNAAARGRVTTIAIGNGWALPPACRTVPPLPLDRNDHSASVKAEQRICEALGAVQADAANIESLTDLMRGDATFVCTPHELDPYETYRDEELYWPPELKVATERRAARPTVPVIYLPHGHPSVEQVVDAVKALGYKAKIYITGPAQGNDGAGTSSSEIDFTTAFPKSPLVIHHGGSGTATWALAYGVPQLVLPMDYEKELLGRSVSIHSLGTSLPVTSDRRSLESAMHQIIGRDISFNRNLRSDCIERIASLAMAA